MNAKTYKSLTLFLAILFVTSSLFTAPASAGDRLWLEQSPAQHKEYIKGGFNEGMIQLTHDSLPAVVSVFTSKNLGNPFYDNDNEQLKEFFKYFGVPKGNMGKSKALGSGFVISPKGYIVTNNHVVENADEVMVAFEEGGEEYPAKVIGTYKMADLALLKIEVDHNLPVIHLGDSDTLQVGELVVAIGNPLGLSHTVTMGIVSQKGRKDVKPSRHIYSNFIQTDASINPGNSGGPLINTYGEVVGINTAMANAQGIGFAVPINMVKKILPQLLEHGRVKKSWIGVQMQEITPELMKSLGLKKKDGALIISVVPGSPADKAKLQPEDVIVQIDEAHIISPGVLSWLVSVSGAGKTVNVKIWRNGKYLVVPTTLALSPQDKDSLSSDVPAVTGKIEKDGTAIWGMAVRDLTPAELKEAPSEAKGGVLVERVERDSPAAGAGIRPGDILLRLNGKPITSAKDLIKRSQKAKKGSLVRFLVLNARENAMFFVAFRI